MRAVAPGLSEARFAAGPPGAGAVQVRQWEGDRLRAAETLGFATSDSPELARTAPDRTLLTRLAAETGGIVLAAGPQGGNPFVHHRQPTWAVRPLWPTLLRVALCLFVLDIALRRLHFEREDWQALRQWCAQRLPWPGARRVGRVPVTEPTLASLLARKEEVRRRGARPSAAGSGGGAAGFATSAGGREPAKEPASRVATAPAVPPASGAPSGTAEAEAVLERLRQARLRARQKLGEPPDSAATG